MKMLDIMAIPLTQGLFALVDGKNYDWLNQWKWCVQKSSYGFRAARSIKKNGKWALCYMSRIIMDAPDHLLVDHRNHCGLDNREVNLRECTNRQNQGNSRFRKDNKSGYKGVSWHKLGGKWQVQIRNHGKVTYLGLFINEVEAAKAYDTKAKEIFGKFAYLNFGA